MVWIQVNNHSATEICLAVLGCSGFLFCALCNEAVSSCNYTVSNTRTIDRRRTGMDMGKCGNYLI